MTILPDPSGIAQGIQQAGGALGEALQSISKRQRLQEILQPYQTMPQQDIATQAAVQPGTTLGGVLEGTEQNVIPVADELFNRRNAEIQYKKRQAAALEGEGYHPQAQMMMQEAHQQESLLQQERLQSQKLGEKVTAEKEKRAFEENKPYYENLSKKRQELPTQQATLLSIRDNLIASGGKIDKIRNFLATFAPADAQDFIKTASAQQLGSFVKDFFVADLKGMPGGSRLNQLIEKNLLSALQSPGKTEESNQKITEFQQYKQDVIEKELEIYDKMRGQYLKAGKEPPRGLQEMVHNQLKPYVMDKQKDLIQTYKDIDDGKFKSAQMLNMPFAKAEIRETPPRPGFTWIMSPQGKPVQAPNNELDKWLNAGGLLIK